MVSETATVDTGGGLFGWTANLTGRQYKILLAAFLGWIFDGYETYALIVAVGGIVTTLLPVGASDASISLYSGLAIGITLLGWATGGVIGGVLTDYLGRKRMMLYSVGGYALFTGLTALSTSVWMLIGFRFLTGLALGSEWETGTALLAETWPDEARSKGAGIMQSGFGFGSLIAAVVWFVVQPLGAESWRYLFGLGILPALLVLYLRSGIGESQMWLDTITDTEETDETTPSSASATAGDETARTDDGNTKRRLTFTVRTLFQNPETRRLVIVGSLLSLATTAGNWGISYLIPEQAGAVAGVNAEYWSSLAGITYTVGAVVGYLVSGWLADGLGRRYYLWFIFVGSLVITPVTFLWVHSLMLLLVVIGVNGFFTLGGFAWFPIYLPELFETGVRGSAMGLIFNSSRFVAFVFPILGGSIIATFGGTARTATAFGAIYILGIVFTWFMPETRGQGLPDA